MKTLKLLYLVSFIEGAALMAVELISSKAIMPFYGNTLYVWSSVLASSLGGLALGYYFGGVLSKNKKIKPIDFVLLALLVSVSLLVLFGKTSFLILSFSNQFPYLIGIVLATMLILFPLMLSFGVLSPLLISCLTNDTQQAGFNSGKIYAVSTVGGIAGTFLTGFYLIPEIGLISSGYFFAACLFLAFILALPVKKVMKS